MLIFFVFLCLVSWCIIVPGREEVHHPMPPPYKGEESGEEEESADMLMPVDLEESVNGRSQLPDAVKCQLP